MGLLLLSTNVDAQTWSNLYFSAGWAVAARQRAFQPTFDFPEPPGRDAVHAVVATAGMKVTQRLGIEGTVTVLANQSFPWRFTYLFAQNTEERATDGDTSFASYLRFLSNCHALFCLEPIVGIGLNWHRASTVTTATCGYYPAWRCTPLADDEPSDSGGSDFLFSGGVDFLVVVSRRLSIGPTLRVTYAPRRKYLLDSYNHRGPQNGSGLMPTVGMTVAWRAR